MNYFCLKVLAFLLLQQIAVLECKSEPRKKRPIRLYHNYRLTHWCITGKDEPDLHTWPWNQFIPFIRQTRPYKYDFYRRQYTFNFTEIRMTADIDIGHKRGGLYKSAHLIFKAFERRSPKESIYQRWDYLPLEGLLIQANHNPEALGTPTGEFFETDGSINCMDCNDNFAHYIPCRKRAQIEAIHPTILAFHYKMNLEEEMENSTETTNSSSSSPGSGGDNGGGENSRNSRAFSYRNRRQDGTNNNTNNGNETATEDEDEETRRAEIHANFRWFSPTCAETRRIEFLVLAVRSFKNQSFDVFRTQPFEITMRGQDTNSELHPSPIFEEFTNESICHDLPSTDIVSEKTRKFHYFEYSPSIDHCTRIIPNSVSEPDYNCPKPTQPRCNTDQAFNSPERADNYWPICDDCPTPMPTTTERNLNSTSIIKRTAHGAIMIFANFCFIPIVCTIARFHKETFNTRSFKGAKLWLLLHMVTGILCVILIYFGYFHSIYVDETYFHVILGHVYIVVLAMCYISGWFRNKDHWLNLVLQFCHVFTGYLAIILALVCFFYSPVGFVPRVLIYLVIAFHLLFCCILTINICRVDRRIGMRTRKHIPTVEAKFDEVAVPGRRFRTIMLIISALITFFLVFLCLFFV